MKIEIAVLYAAMLVIDNLIVRIAGREILDGATASLPAGRRTGLVGRNGAGKSTLLKVILGQLHPDDGTVSWPSAWRIGAVAQEAPGTQVSLLDTVLEADPERMRLLAEAEHESDAHKLGDIYHRLDAIDAYTAPARAAEILAGLGFSAEDQLRPCSEFSGGWRMRVALAAILFAAPDLLLLDEPTNYLDLEGVMWLENFLQRYRGTVLIVSHDRDPAQHRGRVHPASGTRQADALQRQLRHLRRHPRDAPGARRRGAEEAGPPAQAPAKLRRPLPRQGVEGAPGAEPHEDDREIGPHRDPARRACPRRSACLRRSRRRRR
ncbi:MAG: ATP-binding cassette domain-containing protein [Rhizomicrobium sp.]